MADTAFFRLPGGTIQEMDLPLPETMQDQVNAGVLRPVAGPVKAVVQTFDERAGGSITRFVQAAPETGETDPDAVPAGTIDEIMTWVTADPTNRALKALMAEQAKGDKARVSLVKSLGDLVSDPNA